MENGEVKIKGARNFTGGDVVVSKNELYDDIVARGLGITSTARKLGIYSYGKTVKEFIETPFYGDQQLPGVMKILDKRKQGKQQNFFFHSLANSEVQVRLAFDASRFTFQLQLLCVLSSLYRYTVIDYTLFFIRNLSQASVPTKFLEVYRF